MDLQKSVTPEQYLAVSDEVHEAVEGGRSNITCVVKAKAPGIDQRCYGDVKCALGGLGNLESKLDDMTQHGVGVGGLVLIDEGESAVGIESRETAVHLV